MGPDVAVLHCMCLDVARPDARYFPLRLAPLQTLRSGQTTVLTVAPTLAHSNTTHDDPPMLKDDVRKTIRLFKTPNDEKNNNTGSY